MLGLMLNHVSKTEPWPAMRHPLWYPNMYCLSIRLPMCSCRHCLCWVAVTRFYLHRSVPCETTYVWVWDCGIALFFGIERKHANSLVSGRYGRHFQRVIYVHMFTDQVKECYEIAVIRGHCGFYSFKGSMHTLLLHGRSKNCLHTEESRIT